MPHAIWSGSIVFGLVNVPVKMYSAIDEHDLELHLVHEKDGSRIGYQKICKQEGKPVHQDEIVKSFEVEDGEFVYLTDEDFDAAEEESYRTIEVVDFVPLDEIDPIVFHRTYYLGPDAGAEKVYAVLVEAMQASGLAAITQYVFHRRQQLGALRIRDGVITLENMYFVDEIRATDGIVPGRLPRVDKRERDMAATLIDHFTSSFAQGKYEDHYRERLLQIARRKQKGEEVHAPPAPERGAPSDLLDALRASVEAAKDARGPNGTSQSPARMKRPAKAKAKS